MNNPSTDFISENIIAQQISIWDAWVTEIERDGVSTANHDWCVVLWCAYTGYLVMSSKYVGRGTGRTLQAIESEARRFERLATMFTNDVIKDHNADALPPISKAGKAWSEGWHEAWEEG